MLKIFNTLKKEKEKFLPINSNMVNIYVCGVTVYDHCHIGHARTFTIFDTIIRYLKYCGYTVRYIRNITDIDDKIIKSAHKNNENVFCLTNRIITSMQHDFLKLGLLQPDIEPKVTEHIQEIIVIIKELIKKEYAYIAKNGDVIFSIQKYRNYGILSRQNLYALKNNNRINISQKDFKHDFVLWKKLNVLDTPNWNSPWGVGRPGWHIECSAINDKYFGKDVDIHGGGIDLLFPHHENERAQSTCLYEIKNYGKYWMHVGSLLVDNKKMSKSLNNTIFLKKLLNIYDAEVIRYFFLLTHYRKPILYNTENLSKSIISLRKLYLALEKFDLLHIVLKKKFSLKYQFFCTNFCNAMNDDFNTPAAIAVLFSLLKKINISFKKNDDDTAMQLLYQLKYLSNIIGLLYQVPSIFLKNTKCREHTI
ncbi:cysteine--tRNA ligase [Buchnera aphidicola]|uniref:Cysteine--tRNA ligase n=1 Tax=Buchnera aphidicola (Sarucallis kahawaluokalani) TaxID=1241878 RepID=A0A4D6YDD4_9GAMM|nr:cysteine--tRNA ligase [Buchnera aphidicola]QCI26103.1 cysteine--tRNA ligase [Buchnera aphidicola (Sarucallis kahawaluokalani)]